MGSEEIRNKILKPLQAEKPADGGTPLPVDFGTLEKYFKISSDRYDANREDYLSTSLEDPKLIDKMKKCQRSARMFTAWVETWFFTHPDDKDEQQLALDLLDRITKESGMRLDHIVLQEKFVKESDPENTDRLKKLDDAYCSADFFLRSAVKTQQHFNDRFTCGAGGSLEHNEEKEAGRYLEQIAKLIPQNRLYSRGIIFPPAPVPVGEPVPESPEVFNRVKLLPPEDLVYDPELDELVVRPGYVSEDGKIDDKSVIWHPETMTVEMGYVGEEKVVWNYWKPKDITDVIPMDSWCGQYSIREYRQWLQSGKPGLFKRKEWDN